MPQQEIQTYTRLKRKQHSGGRPNGCAGKGGKQKFTTTLRVDSKKRLENLSQKWGFTQGNIIELMLHAELTGATFNEVAHMFAPENHLEDRAKRLEQLDQLLSGAFKDLEIVE